MSQIVFISLRELGSQSHPPIHPATDAVSSSSYSPTDLPEPSNTTELHDQPLTELESAIQAVNIEQDHEPIKADSDLQTIPSNSKPSQLPSASQEERTTCISEEHVSCTDLCEVSNRLKEIDCEQDCASALGDMVRVGGGKELEPSDVQESHTCEQPTTNVLITDDPIKGVILL